MTVVKQKPNLTREELKIIKTLKEDSSIAVVPADKGNTTVFANSANYKEKKTTFMLYSLVLINQTKYKR